MGKAILPLVQIPTLKANRSENNGRLLRKPQHRKLEPLRACISPPDTPEPDEDVDQVASLIHQDRWIQSASSGVQPHAGYPTPRVVPSNNSPVSPAKGQLLSQHRPSLEFNALRASVEDKPDISVSITKQKSSASSQPTVKASKVLLRTSIHAGPEGLPPPEPRKRRTVIPFEMATEKGPSEVEYMQRLRLGTVPHNDPALNVSQFLTNAANRLDLPYENLETVMYSRANFTRLTQMIHEQLSAESNRKQGKITHKHLNSSIPQNDLPYRPSSHAVTGSRIPQKQILIQMASMLTEQIQATMEGRNIRALIKPFPKWTPNKPVDEMPRAEIILYEETSQSQDVDTSQLVVRGEGSTIPSNGIIMRHTSEKHFMDTKRNQSPFEYSGENGLDTTDIALFDALVTGGAVLSLKAHFIEHMPDISPITSTLRYLNLSFNHFQCIPPEVLLLHNLEVLKLRNNPIREIPDEIRHLKYLRTVEMPFCLISSIPDGLYTLKYLQYLDLSYNKLTSLPSNVRRLKSLQVLFVEGNQMYSLPSDCLALPHLHYVRVRNNFMNQVFWPDSMKDSNTPQRLTDLAGLVMKHYKVDERYGEDLPEQAREFLSSSRVCDCCHGHLVGAGIPIIRAASLYGVKNVPFLFKSCSPYCAKLFMENKSHLLDLVYIENEDDIINADDEF